MDYFTMHFQKICNLLQEKAVVFFSPFVPSVTWSQFCSGALSGVEYSELILLFIEPAFLRHFGAHVLSLNMLSK